MALLCLLGFCSVPSGCDSLKCKRGVYEYGESASILADLTNELGVYFAMHLCQLNTKGLRGFARLKTLKVLMSFENEFLLVPKQYVE